MKSLEASESGDDSGPDGTVCGLIDQNKPSHRSVPSVGIERQRDGRAKRDTADLVDGKDLGRLFVQSVDVEPVTTSPIGNAEEI